MSDDSHSDHDLLIIINENVKAIHRRLDAGDGRMDKIDLHLEATDGRVVKLEQYKIWLMAFAGGAGAVTAMIFGTLKDWFIYKK